MDAPDFDPFEGLPEEDPFAGLNFKKRRKPNAKRGRSPSGVEIQFLSTEFTLFTEWKPPATGSSLGGMARHVNWIIANTDRRTLKLFLDPEHLWRTMNYILNYGPGGPNAQLRGACQPALGRQRIHLMLPIV